MPLGAGSLAQGSQRYERQALESQLRGCYGRCAYTHKTHEKQAEQLNDWNAKLKGSQIILSAVMSVGAVSIFFEKTSFAAAVVTALLSFASLVLSSFVKSTDYGQLAQKHRQSAASIWQVREAYESLLTDLMDEGMSLERVRKERDKLQDRLGKIYEQAPSTNSKAYAAAQKGLQLDEELTFSDTELDAMLPAHLRRST